MVETLRHQVPRGHSVSTQRVAFVRVWSARACGSVCVARRLWMPREMPNISVPTAPCQLPSVILVAPDWLSASCDQATAKLVGRRNISNAINPHRKHAHHAAFQHFTPWRGSLPDGYHVDFLGFTAPTPTFCNEAYMWQTRAHALRVRQCKLYEHLRTAGLHGGIVQTAWPVVSEEYLEYSDILSAVDDYARQKLTRPFTLVELGAGYGHWSFAAHKALQQRAPAAAHRYLLVDVVESLRPMVAKLSQLNGVSNGSLHFHVGFISHAARATGSAEAQDVRKVIAAYSKQWGTGRTAGDTAAAQRGHSLDEVLALYSFPLCLDLVDIDIQVRRRSLARPPP